MEKVLVFSRKLFMQQDGYYKRDAESRRLDDLWSKQCDGERVVNGRCHGYGIKPEWCEEESKK